jgi:hypothetical protein
MAARPVRTRSDLRAIGAAEVELTAVVDRRPSNPTNGGFTDALDDFRARTRRHLSRHERHGALAPKRSPGGRQDQPRHRRVKFALEDLELIDRPVGHDRTPVSSAVLAIAGIGAGRSLRRVVLARVNEAACWAQAEGAISPDRAEQIARHVKLALRPRDRPLAAQEPQLP